MTPRRRGRVVTVASLEAVEAQLVSWEVLPLRVVPWPAARRMEVPQVLRAAGPRARAAREPAASARVDYHRAPAAQALVVWELAVRSLADNRELAGHSPVEGRAWVEDPAQEVIRAWWVEDRVRVAIRAWWVEDRVQVAIRA